jgi:DNA helicase II / ATP-dependent DNA helicase PcrA
VALPEVETSESDPECETVVADEEECLTRVLGHLDARKTRTSDRPPVDYETQMLGLRDEIAIARMEDVPPLLEQMERLQILANHRQTVTESHVDARSPYFGRLVLQEGPKKREVLIGRGTYLDTQSGVRIVDWRDAPVSRLYYRYDEGDEYDEVFGNREVNGEVLTRRSVSIVDRTLRRVSSPQGTFARGSGNAWRRLGMDALRLHGGQGTATRAERRSTGKLGGFKADLSEDKHLKEITALIDKRQFELITEADSGLVVIQGGAGSGKTTIALHRLAYLNYRDARRFRPDRMLVVVFNEALARYIAQVLPSLGIEGVAIRTYQTWAERIREVQLPSLPTRYSDDTPSVVTRLKKHPAMLRVIDRYVEKLASGYGTRMADLLAGKTSPEIDGIRELWQKSHGRPLAHRVHQLSAHLEKAGKAIPTDLRVALERLATDGIFAARDVMTAWAELMSDRTLLGQVFQSEAPDALSSAELTRAETWCAARASELLREVDDASESETPERDKHDKRDRHDRHDRHDDHHAPSHGVDGREVEEKFAFDREDDALLLRLCQRLRGPLLRSTKGREALVYEHVLVDEAQDLSPVELAVVLDTVSSAQSVTLAGDTAQRLLMDNGFTNWKTVLAELGMSHVEVEPLKLSYRSTQEIIEFAQDVLGPLAPEEKPIANRSGVPVDLFMFAHTGDAVGFLGEALRELVRLEPRASIAVVSRYPEQADLFHQGLIKGEVPHLRRIARQDFPFKPGVDVTDIRQVKGLEFDYVVMVEVNDSSYPEDDEARHLLHIGATRAAHQLWILSTGRPSTLLPEELKLRGY